MEYFFNNIKNIFSLDYIPTKEDILKMRIRTTGMVQANYNVVLNSHFDKV